MELDKAAQELLFTEARTANAFSPEPVSDETLRAIWELAKWAPTAMNSNPLRVVYLRTEEAKARLIPHMSEGNQAKTATAPVVAVLAADSAFHEHMPHLFPIREGMREYFAGDDAARTHTAEFNSALQAGYFLLAVRAAGLAAGPMGGFDRAGVDGEFFADGRHRSIMVVNIGKPGEGAWFDRLPRLDYDEVVTLA
ncbi:malonic semialdehyde reductase [Allokutzneria sp. A3M-2-11 16]|uniref:malonic semialdehyde reductase n=1 Tax=Allokutzneria sp. A3M-2-11 16 TaxID=2962043 RepID=UPI0020B750DE|nr:malonic semialdehyde reductase [Allokutzneria sp. A3M-2-11 16]MCP3803934.1 malonic semialdehyde reductase [Allokutzneria sp. A3M-2-11 16]